MVHLALHAPSRAEFLDIDAGLVGLLETAADRATGDLARARVLARLGYELLGDASAGPRRRALVDEALRLARRGGDPRTVAAVLDARLHALWDPAAADDRLAAASEIVELARAAHDADAERRGLFWRFVALMELGQVASAESALAAFARAAETAGDGAAGVMVTSRHAMLAVLRGRFDQTTRLIDEVAAAGRRAGLVDTDRLVEALRGAVTAELGARADGDAAIERLLALSRRLPGHFFEATAARILAELGRTTEAGVELERLLPRLLAGSGPRWLGCRGGPVGGGRRHREHDRRRRAVRRPAAVPGKVGRLGRSQHGDRAGEPLPGAAGAPARPAGGRRRAPGPRAGLGGGDRGAARPRPDPGRPRGRVGARSGEGDLDRADADRRRARSIAERLGMRMLLDSLTPPADEWRLRRDGSDWLLEAGGERARLRDGRGLHYLRALLAAPGRDIAALDLVAGGAGLRASDTGPVLDAVGPGRLPRPTGGARRGSWTPPTGSAIRGGPRRRGSSATPCSTSCDGPPASAAGHGPWIWRPSGPG